MCFRSSESQVFASPTSFLSNFNRMTVFEQCFYGGISVAKLSTNVSEEMRHCISV